MSADGRTPVGPEARGKLRAWKRIAQQRRERVVRIFNSDAFGKIGVDFRQKRGLGQRRALAKLRAMLAEARYIGAHPEPPAHALWAILSPRCFRTCSMCIRSGTGSTSSRRTISR